MKDYKYFKASELRCKCGKCDGGEMDDDFMNKIILIRELCDFPFVISSAFRCQNHNYNVGGAKNSLHTKGAAIDILCDSQQAHYIIHYAMDECIGGIGVSQKGKSNRFIHLDDGAERIWSY